jgi:hypothetical protein
MNVQFICVSGGGKRCWSENLGQLLTKIVSKPDYTRIAFGGRTQLGKSGVAINLLTGKVTGHKLEPIPYELLNLVRHVPLSEAYQGFEYLVRGEDVLIGTSEHGVAIKWNGTGLEIYAAGEDSETDLSLGN